MLELEAAMRFLNALVVMHFMTSLNICTIKARETCMDSTTHIFSLLSTLLFLAYRFYPGISFLSGVYFLSGVPLSERGGVSLSHPKIRYIINVPCCHFLLNSRTTIDSNASILLCVAAVQCAFRTVKLFRKLNQMCFWILWPTNVFVFNKNKQVPGWPSR